MRDEIMIISTSESFAVKSMETKLDGVGISSYQVFARISDIGKGWDKAGLIVLYLDERMAAMVASLQNMLSYINDKLYETNKKLIIIGKSKEFEIAKRYISDDFILQFFERPINMENFVQTVTSHMIDMNVQDAGGDTSALPPVAAQQKEEKPESKFAYKKKKILLVDDDASYLRIIRNWLKDSYEVGVASSGLQAIMWLAKNEVDLILLDYKMPVASGAQIFAMLKNDSQTENLPVFFLTGNSDRDSVMEILKLNPEGYLLKTFDRKALMTRLEEFFEFR